jgi:hypothetical protein
MLAHTWSEDFANGSSREKRRAMAFISDLKIDESS